MLPTVPKNGLMVLYKDKQGKKYVRERTEFYQKFSLANLRSFE